MSETFVHTHQNTRYHTLKNTTRKIKKKKSHFEFAQLKLCYKLRKAAERMFWGYERNVLSFKCLENRVSYGNVR